MTNEGGGAAEVQRGAAEPMGWWRVAKARAEMAASDREMAVRARVHARSGVLVEFGAAEAGVVGANAMEA